MASFFRVLVFLSVCILGSVLAQAQGTLAPGTPMTLQNAPQRDTSNKTNDDKWHDEDAVIYYKKLEGQQQLNPDTSLHTFHRRPFTQPWLRDLGNTGTAIYNMFFTPEYRVGPTLGYRVFDAYRFVADSLLFYNTTRPYSVFAYNLGSKSDQVAGIMHTQNIMPRWNFAVQYRKVNSPGFFKSQRTIQDAGGLSTNYISRKQHYQLQAGITYNKVQQDENGGQPTVDTFLQNSRFSDRRTIPVAFQDDDYSQRRSPVSNTLRDFTILLHHSYTLGRMDTLYNEDSTKYSFRLVPRFRLGHRLRINSEKYQFKDDQPDSLRYTWLFARDFSSNDSVYMQQKWVSIDNTFLVEGLIGPEEKQTKLNAGYGIRTDRFTTSYATGELTNTILSNYLIGELSKEATGEAQWAYDATAQFFLTGEAAGSFLLKANVGKNLSERLGTVSAGFQQSLNQAPYNYTIYQNQYFGRTKDYSKESVTQIYGTVQNNRLGMQAGIRNYLITNYIYLNQKQEFAQYSSAFNILQVWGKKTFRFGKFVLDNELAFQQKGGDAPVNIPTVMGRHQFSLERYLFANALKIATGIDVRWHTAYNAPGYSPFFARFYYNDSYNVSNAPEAAIFFSFKVKRFRAFIMGDQLQQLVTRNNINFPGYPAQDVMIRFGFNWVMIN